MIRPAKFQDVPAIAGMLREMHDASKYRDRSGINDKALEATLMGLIAQQNQPGPQGSHCSIAENGSGPVGFIAGLLDRIYHIGDKLAANDVYLWVGPNGTPIHTLGLVRAYLAWAKANRKVINIKLSWTDTLPGADRLGRLYRRVGAAKVGEIYELRLDAGEAE